MLLTVAAPLLLNHIAGLKTRKRAARTTSKGVVSVTRFVAWVESTLHNIGCGLTGGLLAQT